MEFKNTTVSNFQGAFRGLRNPLESWHKSDSEFGIDLSAYCGMDWEVACRYVDTNEKYDYEQEYDKYYDAQEKYADWLDDNGIDKAIVEKLGRYNVDNSIQFELERRNAIIEHFCEGGLMTYGMGEVFGNM